MTSRAAVNAAVKEAYEAGLCIIPPREDGSKAPDLATWKALQEDRPSLDDLREIYRRERFGLGTLGGPVAGELEVFECETEEIWKRFRMAMADGGYEDLVERAEEGYLERAPRGGVHYLWRTEKAGRSKKLAVTADFQTTLIEVKAAGGYCILAPSYGPVHPTGRAYERLGGSFLTIPTFEQEERDTWYRVAATFDLRPKTDGIPTPPPTDAGDLSLPGNDFNLRGSWHDDVLEPVGWTFCGAHGDGAGRPQEFWRRPGKDRGNSAVLHPEAGHGGLFVVFSTSTPFETEVGYSKFRAYAILHHGGDFAAAARELKRRGYGQKKEERIWTPPKGAMWGGDLFDYEVPPIETLPLLKEKGMLMERAANLLYAYPKTGKTEVVCEFLPEWITLGKQIVYLTEEPLGFWKPRLHRFKFEREFWNGALFVSTLGWSVREVFDFLVEKAGSFDVLVVDTLRNTCGFQEGEGDKDVTRVVLPLIALTREKDATLLALYHARKMPGEDGRDISGHHSLYGAFDRALQLRKVSGENNDTKRRIVVSGRLITPETPNGMTYEMTPDGHFRSLEVRRFTDWEQKKAGGQ